MYRFLRKKILEPLAIRDRRKKLKTNIGSYTIISRNCIGGIIYHDLGLQFKSPIINMYIDTEDFFLLCNDLESFLSLDTVLIEKTDCKLDFPVGILTSHKGESIILYFMHYHDFKQAKEKWYERCTRVNFEKILIIFEDISNLNIDFNQLKKIPYQNTFSIVTKYQAKMITNIDKDYFIIIEEDLNKGSDLFAYKICGGSAYRKLDDLNYIERILNYVEG